MREYSLNPPKDQKDEHGQPSSFFKFNAANNVSKAIDQLSGICAGILADGVVNDVEAKYFADWVRKHAIYEPVWPFTDILKRVDRIFADGQCDEEEREELRMIMQSICGQSPETESNETYSSTLPLNSPPPHPIELVGKQINITGRFAFGTRKKVMSAITDKNGIASDDFPTRKSAYLVIGTFASRDWINTNFGRKIERAVELRESGCGIAIISEEHWRQFIL